MSAGGNEVLRPGTVLTTAVLSPCVGGLVRTWTDSGSQLGSLEDPAALRRLMGHGALARSPVGPDRFREAA